MAKQLTVKAKGDAPNTGAPGKTPAPTTADMARAKDTAYGRTSYGANAYAGRVVVDPGKSVSSPLADELRRVNAQGDGGDLLGRIISKSTRGPVADLDLQAPQTRPYTAEQKVPTSHGMKPANVGGSPSGTVPSKLGKSVAVPVRKP